MFKRAGIQESQKASRSCGQIASFSSLAARKFLGDGEVLEGDGRRTSCFLHHVWPSSSAMMARETGAAGVNDSERRRHHAVLPANRPFLASASQKTAANKGI